jgi:hypothetical protein
MDPLDQRLTDAGAAWRQSQPAPPDLDRLVASLDRRPSRAFSPRLGFLLAAGLVLLGAVAIAPGVGGVFDGFRSGPPITATTAPSSVPATPTPTPPTSIQPSDASRASALVDTYEAALVAAEWQTAFDLLAPASPTRGLGLAGYTDERGPFYESVAGRYVLGEPTQDVADWTTYAPLIEGADVSRAYLIEVDYPALSGNNAGYEQFVVAPDASGSWWIWPVR